MNTFNDLKTIGDVLAKAESVAIFPHIIMDGDAIGSAAALAGALKDLGKECSVVLEDEIPELLAFLATPEFIGLSEIPEGKAFDVTLCIDCGDYTRFPLRRELFKSGRTRICLDHHKTSEGIGDLNYIDPEAAATGEIVYDLLKAMDWPIDPSKAGALYAAIVTDTGNFSYSNTTARTHQVVSALYEAGLEPYPINLALYENEPISKFRLYGKVLDTMELFAGGKGVIGAVTQEMIAVTGGTLEDGEGIIANLRAIRGVEIAVLLKEQTDTSVVRVSLRSKNEGDVAAIAARHDGGGHTKAAGCTFRDTTVPKVWDLLKEEVTAALDGGE